MPGIILGAIIRVFLASGPTVFRILAASVLIPLGIWLLTATRTGPTNRPVAPRTITALALALGIGIVGGIYGVGGGSLLAPILVGTGMRVATVAPAALLSTVLTSIVGALTYALLALTTTGPIAPNWALGLTCGFGGLLAVGLAATYLTQGLLRTPRPHLECSHLRRKPTTETGATRRRHAPRFHQSADSCGSASAAAARSAPGTAPGVPPPRM